MSDAVQQSVRPMVVNIAQANNPHTADMEHALSAGTQGYAYRCAGGSRSWAYPHFDPNLTPNGIPPIAKITALNTWYDFQIQNAKGSTVYTPYQQPWRLPESYRGVLAIITIGSLQYSQYTMRMQSRTLVSAITTTTGNSQTIIPARPPVDMEWGRADVSAGGAYKINTIQLMLDNPALASDRLMAIFPQILLSDTNNPAIGIGQTVHVFINEIILVDLPDTDAGW